MDTLTKKKYFQEEGYVVIPNLISSEKIEKLLKNYEIFKNKNSFFYSQSHHNWNLTKECLDEFGNLTYSIENFTDLILSLKFSKAGRNILQSNEILYWLQNLGNHPNFSMHGNMFFDKSTATADHLDTWYIDTNPRGSLIAVWIALENINGDGGAFVVYPKTHKLDKFEEFLDLDHEDYLSWASKFALNLPKKELLIKKGDVVFWHPSLLHGSSEFTDSKKTRKSLTAHYFPDNYLRSHGREFQKNMNTQSYKDEVEIQMKKGRYFSFPIKAQRRRREIFIKNFYGILNKLRSKYNDPKMLMNRKYVKN